MSLDLDRLRLWTQMVQIEPASLSLCSSDPGSDDGRWDAEAHQTQGTLGFPTRVFGLCCHGYVFFPSSPRQPSRHGVQVPSEPPGAGGQWIHLYYLNTLLDLVLSFHLLTKRKM